jgi:protein SCO1/2
MKFFVTAVFLAVALSIGMYYMRPHEKPLKVYNPVDVDSKMVDTDIARKGFGHKIQDFQFSDQHNHVFDSKALTGKVYVAEYFFTTCKSICPIMNSQMKRVQQAYKDESSFNILSFTVDPEVDKPEQLAKYAENHGAITGKWFFLTGKKEDLYRLARRSYFVLKPAEVKNQGDVGSDFIHTNNFVLVDQKKRIRGYYDGTSHKEVDQLINDIKRLLKEEL